MVMSPLHACLLWPLASDRGSGFPLDSRLARVARAVNAVTPDITSLTAILPFTGTHDCIAIVATVIATSYSHNSQLLQPIYTSSTQQVVCSCSSISWNYGGWSVLKSQLFISRILSIHFFLLGLFCRLLSDS
ncbi:unnamed protein product [Sphagnum jensenii]|uniref:Uncharacterized protein n=1 Tax=Sphagnum jensenii TaxID=128206 RepID=A0ABP1BLU4_9BRYO